MNQGEHNFDLLADVKERSTQHGQATRENNKRIFLSFASKRVRD